MHNPNSPQATNASDQFPTGQILGKKLIFKIISHYKGKLGDLIGAVRLSTMFGNFKTTLSGRYYHPLHYRCKYDSGCTHGHI